MDITNREEDLLAIDWYHPLTNRHVAESLLLQNGSDGMYLLRPCSKAGSSDLSLSVRCKEAVLHYTIHWTGKSYKFGMSEFFSLQELTKHFDNQPLIGGESGITTACRSGYPRDIAEPQIYDNVQIHAELGRHSSLTGNRKHRENDLAIGSKEGFLTKQGGNVKNWKIRWFVLNKNVLKYFRDRGYKEPIRELNLAECSECCADDTQGKKNCFRLVFPWRTFFIFGATKEDAETWMKMINWKLEQLSRH